MKKVVIIAACFVCFGASGSAFANLITNGDFESGDLSDWIIKGDVHIAQAGPIASAVGMDDHYALLGAHTTDGVSALRQDIDLTGFDKKAVTVSFDWAFLFADNSWSADDTFLAILKDDGSSERITMKKLKTNGTSFYNADLGLEFGHFTYTYDLSSFSGDEARAIFRLVEESDPYCWTGTSSVAGIDNVSVTAAPVPEPATILLLGTGIAGLATSYRRKAKN